MSNPPNETLAARPDLGSVMIIEDSDDQGEILEIALRRIRLRTFWAANGKLALANYHTFKPDVVLLDINLPDMTGWEVLDALKEMPPEPPRAAVIVITAFGDQANRLAGKLRGVDAYLVKPFTPEYIQRVVKEVLENRRLGRSSYIETP